MSALTYGLNITKKPSSLATRPPPAKRKTIFDDDSGPEDGPDNEDSAEVIDTIGGLTPSSNSQLSRSNGKPTKAQSSKSKPSQISQYGDLSTHRTTSKHATTAQSLDPRIYDYDSVYDSLHAKSKAATSSSDDKRPKYMSNLLAAAEVRKRDQLRAKDKMLVKEREAEGEEFADKEKFVTEAYKAQQEEVKRMEEEEAQREREEEERKRKGGGGMVGLYRGLLDRDEKKHAEVVKAVEEAKGKGVDGEQAGEEKEKQKSETELAKEKGALMNDEGQVVDKRQLLNAGLNVAPKPKPTPSNAGNGASSAASSRGGMPAGFQGRGGTKQAMRERQSRMLEAQLEQAAKRAADDEDEGRKELERAAKSRKTEGDVSSARERYLQRKKDAAAAAAAAAGGGGGKDV
ncbi:hypothetical protein MMC24_000703 [Lignoscripta atroalba]|nr:hypothetical protein [Lignoscripta atroalba]